MANDLEIPLQKEKVIFMGVGKNEVAGFWGKIEIKVGDKSYETKAIFAEISKFGHGILGQQGFFDHFDVKLSYQKQTIELGPISFIYTLILNGLEYQIQFLGIEQKDKDQILSTFKFF